MCPPWDTGKSGEKMVETDRIMASLGQEKFVCTVGTYDTILVYLYT
jgi:hypothetical protein